MGLERLETARDESDTSRSSKLQTVQRFYYTAAVIAAAAIALTFPQFFIQVGGFRLQRLIVPLLQIIMVGVGCTMGWRDIADVLRMPKAVLIGVFCHYAIMPLVAFLIAHIFGFPAEISAGVILVGCCPSGLASNVIALLSRANIPLSVTITTFSTLLAPIMTPLLMKALGGGYIAISVSGMIIDMVKLVIVPICLGIAINWFFKDRLKLLLWIMPKVSMTGIALIIVVITAAGRDSLLHVGVKLVLAMFLHMTVGFSLGYLGAKWFRLPEADCRTISIEVGMQNGGLASGIAVQMGKIATMGLAAAVNGPVMNITFSMLGSWWGSHPPKDPQNIKMATASPGMNHNA